MILKSIHEIEDYLIQDTKILDVRAEVEFLEGQIPYSENIPILNNQERALVGTSYKKQGREPAIKLGHQLVSGENKSLKIEQWKKFIQNNPQALLTCFRGGLRSQLTQKFLAELGIEINRIEGGYKKIRQIYINTFEQFSKKDDAIQILTGLTGSGKTLLIEKLDKNLTPHIDLEKIAAHRGSAFGKRDWPQPAQATFENAVAHELLKFLKKENNKILLEDESRLIGHNHIPENLFIKMRQAPVIQMLEPIEQRVQNIYGEYILNDLKIYEQFSLATEKIRKKLGGLRAGEILNDIETAKKDFIDKNELTLNKIWIEKLLVWYYDPMYVYSFKLRNPQIVFKGNRSEIENYLQLVSI